MKATKYRIGTHNLDDLSDIIELYIPEDAASGNFGGRTLHIRGRELLPHHLQHYFIPYGKVFLAVRAANIRLTTTSVIGLFGTHYRWRKQTNLPWEEGFNYWNHIHHRLHNGTIYYCTANHTSVAGVDGNEPGIGIGDDWHNYWDKGEENWSLDWKPNIPYKFNQVISHPFVWVGHDDLPCGYRCTANHTSGELGSVNEPGKGASWTDYWDIGDEMQSDLSPLYGGASAFFWRVFLSKGMTTRFDEDILVALHGYTSKHLGNVEGRAIDALTVSGDMKARGILYGIEVDEADAGYEYGG